MTTLTVAAGIFVREGRLLLARRPFTGSHPGLWEFPGGKVEPGESPEAALIREWKEELDVTIGGPLPYRFTTERQGDRHLTILFFSIRALRREPRPVGVEAVRWCGAEEARLLALPPADQPILASLTANGVLDDTEIAGWEFEDDPYIVGSEDLSTPRKFRKRDRPEGFLLATRAGVRAYVNVCPHVPIPLDRDDADLFSHDGETLVCHNHGALFLPETGLCIAGPCRGESLTPIPVRADGEGWAVTG